MQIPRSKIVINVVPFLERALTSDALLMPFASQRVRGNMCEFQQNALYIYTYIIL